MRTRMRYAGVAAVFAAMSCILASSVGARSLLGQPEPIISGLAPEHAVVGQAVTIFGSGLDGTAGVTFGPVLAKSVVVDPGGAWVRAIVPAGVPAGPAIVTLDGRLSIGPMTIEPGSIVPPQPNPQPVTSVSKANGAVKVVVAPRIDSLSPLAARVGTRVTINGANFGHSLWVKFGGVRAHFTVLRSTAIVAVVPRRAHSGRIKVHTTGGTGVSGQRFVVMRLARPGI